MLVLCDAMGWGTVYTMFASFGSFLLVCCVCCVWYLRCPVRWGQLCPGGGGGGPRGHGRYSTQTTGTTGPGCTPTHNSSTEETEEAC